MLPRSNPCQDSALSTNCINSIVLKNIIGDIINSQWDYIRSTFNSFKIRILNAIRRCRTPAMGGSLYRCNSCGHFHKRYHSCRNRNCPVCQNTQKEEWVQKQQEQVLPCTYYHVVFTVPHQLNELFLAYPRQLYKLLFDASWQCLNQFGWNPKFLGAQIGATSVLHTWGSNLSYHPHIHCIVPGGGITLKNKWKIANGNGKFLFPVQAMSPVFRGIFMKKFKDFCQRNGLDDIDDLTNELYKISWIVYAKPPFGGTEGVIRYLARYTHKIAITNHRIIDFSNNTVTFSYTDYRHRNQKKKTTLSAQEFVRRFAMHILPKGFCRIRHYGILSSTYKNKLFPNIPKQQTKTDWVSFWKNKGLDVLKCPQCQSGRLVFFGELVPIRGPPPTIQKPPQNQSSVSLT